MSLPHDEQPLTRRQLREMERQKPRKEREADAKAAAEAEAARKAASEREAAEAADAGSATGVAEGIPSRRVIRQQGPAVPVEAASVEPSAEKPSADEPAAEKPAADEPAADDDTIIPEVVDDEAVDDSEPAASSDPVIDVVPLTETVIVTPADETRASDGSGEHIEVVAVADDESGPAEESTVVEEMVIDHPDGDDIPEDAPASASTPSGQGTPPLAPVFQAPAARSTTDTAPSSFDDLLSLRNTAAANSISTTSALVLPTVPGSNDVGTALDETGEVIITGSIDLPSSFGSQGAPATGLESNDLDAILERSETESPASDVAPVSAARAISTNTSSTSIMAPPKRARANAPLVLAITAGVLAVGVVSLLLAVFVFRVF
jgi:hypothetical protein